MRVKITGKIVEIVSCECEHCSLKEDPVITFPGRSIDVDMEFNVEHKIDADRKAESELLATHETFNDWEVYEWETIAIEVLIDADEDLKDYKRWITNRHQGPGV